MPKIYGTMGSGEYGPIPSNSKGNGELGGIPYDKTIPNINRGPNANTTSGLGTQGGKWHEATVDGFTSSKSEKPFDAKDSY